MYRIIMLLECEGNQRRMYTNKRRKMKITHKIRTVVASQLRSLIMRWTPAKNATDRVARVTPKRGVATLRAKRAKFISCNWAQMSIIVTLMPPYMDVVMQKINGLNHTWFSITAMPCCPGVELLFPPGKVKPVANVTVVIRVETNIRVLILSL